MALFDRKSVIIVGAGASVDLGLPLGTDLWNQVRSDISICARRFEEFGSHNLHNFREHYSGNTEPSALIAAMLEGKVGFSPTALHELVGQRNVHNNVDEFVRDNGSTRDVLMALVAETLFKKLYQSQNGGWRRRPEITYPLIPNSNGTAHIENWMVTFVGFCRQFLDGKKHLLDVISFNYDHIFETVVRQYWSVFEKGYLPFDECVRFVYPQGAFSVLPEQVGDAREFLSREHANFGVAAEAAAKLPALTEEAEILFSLGFSFSDTNVEILGLKPVHGKKLRVQNFGNADVRLRRVLSGRFGVGEAHLDVGATHDLIRNGFFELS